MNSSKRLACPQEHIRKVFAFACVIIAWYPLSLAADVSASPAIQIDVPSARHGHVSERNLAPLRDFYVIGRITGVSIPEIGDIRIDVSRHQENGPVHVRSLSAVCYREAGSLYGSFPGLIYSTGELPDDPMPDLVWDGRSVASVLEPQNKVSFWHRNGTVHFAALVQGGVLHDFATTFRDETNSRLVDLEAGAYTLTVSAIGRNGDLLARSDVPLSFRYSGMVFFRFSSKPHIEAVRNLSRKDFRLLEDPLPGNWIDSSGKRAEIRLRWKANDFLEYAFSPRVLGVIYDISEQSVTAMELATVMHEGHLESDDPRFQTYLYYYDVGEPEVLHQRRGGELVRRRGTLVPFPGSLDPFARVVAEKPNNTYTRLVLTRAETSPPYGTQAGSAARVYGQAENLMPRLPYGAVQPLSSQALENGSEALIIVRPEEDLSLFGVVAPIPSVVQRFIIQDEAGRPDLVLSPANRITTLLPVLRGPAGDERRLDPVDVRYSRAVVGHAERRESVYEFRIVLPAKVFDGEGVYHLRVIGIDAHANVVPRTVREVVIQRTSTGIHRLSESVARGNQQAAADAFLDKIREANFHDPTAAERYRNMRETEVSDALDGLSGTPLLNALSTFYDDPVEILEERLRQHSGTAQAHATQIGDPRIWCARSIAHDRSRFEQSTGQTPESRISDVGCGREEIRFPGTLRGRASVHRNTDRSNDRLALRGEEVVAASYGRTPTSLPISVSWFRAESRCPVDATRVNSWTGFREHLESTPQVTAQYVSVRLDVRPAVLGWRPFTLTIGWQEIRRAYDPFLETGGDTALSFSRREEQDKRLFAIATLTRPSGSSVVVTSLGYLQPTPNRVPNTYAGAFTGADAYLYRFSGTVPLADMRFWLSESRLTSTRHGALRTVVNERRLGGERLSESHLISIERP